MSCPIAFPMSSSLQASLTAACVIHWAATGRPSSPCSSPAAALALLKWGLHKDVDHAWRAYRGWLLMVPLGLGCIFLGRAVAITLFTVVAAFGFKEFARATGLYQDWFMTGAVYLGIIATGIVS